MSLMLDITLGSAILASSIVQMDMQTLRTAERTIAISTGQYLSGLQGGVNKYIATNGDVLAGRSAGPITNPSGGTITIANPLAPTVAELQQNGFLPLGFTTNNPGKLTLAVSIQPSNCPGVGCTLPATITTSQYRDLQGNVRNDLAAYVMNAAGLDGGQALPGNPSNFTGVAGSWSLPNAGGGSGAIAMRAGSLTTGYVDTLPFYKLDGSRKLTGTMQANGQNITGAGNISSASLNTGPATASTMTLPAGNSLKIAGTALYGDSTNIAVRAAPGGSAYMQDTNGNYVPMNAGTVNANGNANVSGNMSANGVYGNYIQSNGSLWVGGTATAGQMNASNSNIWGNQTVYGTHTVNGALVANNVVYLPALAWEGYGCSRNGITTDPTGKILSCQSGVWRQPGGSGPHGPVVGFYWGQGSPGGPCGGFIANFADGTQQTVMVNAGCSY